MTTVSTPSEPEGTSLHELATLLGHDFKNKELLAQALHHSSACCDSLQSNERLEFLGDAILGAVISETLFNDYPELPEGDLTRRRAQVVDADTLMRVGCELNLSDYLTVGKGLACHKPIPLSLVANAVEAIIGAVFLDSGHEASGRLVRRLFSKELVRAAGDEIGGNYKSVLQEYTQKHMETLPVYQDLQETGPPHQRRFEIAVLIKDAAYGSGWGSSKKQAEQEAARCALKMLHDDR